MTRSPTHWTLRTITLEGGMVRLGCGIPKNGGHAESAFTRLYEASRFWRALDCVDDYPKQLMVARFGLRPNKDPMRYGKVATEYGITRQAAWETVQRGAAQLFAALDTLGKLSRKDTNDASR